MSQFRDDRVALRARADGLEQQLAEVNEELQRAQEALRQAEQSTSRDRVEQLEQDAQGQKKQLAALRKELRRTKKALNEAQESPSQAQLNQLEQELATTRQTLKQLQGPVNKVPRAHDLTPRQHHLRLVVGLAFIALVLLAARSAISPPASAPGLRSATWDGSVVESSDPSLKPGTPCIVMAGFAELTYGSTSKVDHLQVHCNGKTVFEAGSGTPPRNAAVTEQQGGNGALVSPMLYTLVYDHEEDTLWAPREISLSSPARTARIWRDTFPHVDLRLSLEPTSHNFLSEVLSPRR
ncbi:hypothetical protein [Chondromyces crocatus]|uniref:Uncharacterized protein n=1 Tax=Chondromyces crocatus TaxID=52 RepID=A0A0K1ELM0_CHOCO|nr:hypothetical protein [Chondromyces crocatus]AKT41790.1 uncharacterized protein CMC5_060010 [Chondromyces crocatus]